MKIQEVHERYHLAEGGYVYIDYNCVDLSTYRLECVHDTEDVTYMPSTLIIGKGKGESNHEQFIYFTNGVHKDSWKC